VRLIDHDQDNALVFSHEDPFPIDPNEELETQQFTVRAVLVGSCLGGVITASKSVPCCFPWRKLANILSVSILV
jgi:hypothetical protein